MTNGVAMAKLQQALAGRQQQGEAAKVAAPPPPAPEPGKGTQIDLRV